MSDQNKWSSCCLSKISYIYTWINKEYQIVDTSNPLPLVTEEYCQLCTKLFTGGRPPINSLFEDQDGINLAGKEEVVNPD